MRKPLFLTYMANGGERFNGWIVSNVERNGAAESSWADSITGNESSLPWQSNHPIDVASFTFTRIYNWGGAFARSFQWGISFLILMLIYSRILVLCLSLYMTIDMHTMEAHTLQHHQVPRWIKLDFAPPPPPYVRKICLLVSMGVWGEERQDRKAGNHHMWRKRVHLLWWKLCSFWAKM